MAKKKITKKEIAHKMALHKAKGYKGFLTAFNNEHKKDKNISEYMKDYHMSFDEKKDKDRVISKT